MISDIELAFNTFAAAVKTIREAIARANYGSHVSIRLRAEGYPTHGDFKLTVEIVGNYSEINVKANALPHALAEFQRQVNFQKHHQPVLIPYSGETN